MAIRSVTFSLPMLIVVTPAFQLSYLDLLNSILRYILTLYFSHIPCLPFLSFIESQLHARHVLRFTF